jgi:O-antigen/teichoic acid export membrane protein
MLSLAGLVLTLFAKEIIAVAAPQFGQAYKAVGPLILGTVMYGLGSLVAIGLSIAKRTGRLALLSVLAAAVNIGLNFAFIPPFRIVGASLATAIGYGVLAVSFYRAAQHVYPTPYELRKVLTTLALASLLGAVGVLPLHPEGIAIAVKLLAIAVFVVGLRLTGTITGAEFSELRRFILGMIPARPGRAGA